MIANESIGQSRSAFRPPIILGMMLCGAALVANFAPSLILVPIAIGIFAYFWNRREKLVIIMLLCTPFEELLLKILPDQYYAPVRYMWEGLLLAFMLAMFWEKVVLKRAWRHSVIDLPLIIFVAAWFFSGMVNSRGLYMSSIYLKNLIRYIPLFYILFNLNLTSRFIRKIIYLIIAMAAFQSLVCFAEAVDSRIADIFAPKEVIVGSELVRGEDVQLGTYYTRFSGTLARNVHLGNYLAFALCLLAALWASRHRAKWIIWALAIITTALFLSSSRISWISAFAGVATILFVSKSRRRFVFLTVPLILMALVLAGGYLNATGNLARDFNILNRFYYIFSADYIETISNIGRLYTIFYAVPAVAISNPILGIGPGSFMRISEQVSSDDAYGRAAELGLNAMGLNFVHDVGYAALFIQVGIIGLTTLLWLFIRVFRAARIAYKSQIRPELNYLLLGFIGVIAALAVQNIASFNLMYRNQSLVIRVLCGLTASAAISGKSRVIADDAPASKDGAQ